MGQLGEDEPGEAWMVRRNLKRKIVSAESQVTIVWR